MTPPVKVRKKLIETALPLHRSLTISIPALSTRNVAQTNRRDLITNLLVWISGVLDRSR